MLWLLMSPDHQQPWYVMKDKWIIVFYEDGFKWPSPEQNGRHFADDSLRRIFVNEKFCILIKFSLKFVLNGTIDNNPALAKIMTWHHIGDKPSSEPMLIRFTDAYVWYLGEMC